MQKKRIGIVLLIVLFFPQVHSIMIDSDAENSSLSSIPVIIHLDHSLPPSQVMAAVSMNDQLKTRFVNARNVHALDGYDIIVKKEYTNFPLISALISQKGLSALKSNALVKSIEFDRNVSIHLDKSGPFVGAPEVNHLMFHNQSLTGKGSAVCIIDTGVDYTNPNLGGSLGKKVIGGYDFIHDDTDPKDDNGHGTFVAGIISSSHSKYKGIAPDVSLIAIKALDETGSGSFSDIIAGIDYCISNKEKFNISVISMSLGVDDFHTDNSDECNDLSTAVAIREAINKNIPVVISSGNSGFSDGISYPACVSEAIAVGATDNEDHIASFSNSGALLDILAPGVGITSTGLGNSFLTGSGTSFSAPHVAALIAILAQIDKLDQTRTLSAQDIATIITSSGVQLRDSRNNRIFPRENMSTAVFTLVGKKEEDSPATITLTLYPPLQMEYNTRSIPVYVHASEIVDVLQYTLDSSNHARVLCKECSSVNKTISANDGNHTLKIDALKDGVTIEKIIIFSVDSTKPRILSFESAAEKLNGTFLLSYTDVFLRNVSLYYKTNTTPFTKKIETHCPRGEKQTCVLTQDLSSFNHNTLSFFVSLADSFSVINSTVQKNEVDTLSPSITIISPLDKSILETKVVTLQLSSNEIVDTLYAIDKERPRSFCSRCTSELRKRTLSDGNHSLNVVATDLGGNTYSSQTSFTINH